MKRMQFLAILLVLPLFLIGIVHAQTDVVVQVSWVHAPTWAGIYAAQDEGHYTDHGLNVELHTVFDDEGNRLDPIEEVVSGRAQFGSVSTQVLLEARSAGAPIVAIGTLYQFNPAGFTSLAESNILSPADLVGKTVSTSDSSRYLLEAMLDVVNIDPADVNIVDRTDFTLNPLIDGEIDVLSTFVMNSEASLSIQGVEFNTIYPFEYGVDMYSNLIFTSEEVIENNPELVQNFLEATAQGIESAVDDPEKIGLAIAARDAELDAAELVEGMFRSVPILLPTGSHAAMMDDELWQLGYDILVEQGILTEEMDVTEAYTLEFLNAIYAEG